MTTIEMEKINNLSTHQLLNCIEEYWGFKLVDQYRKFILETNGGIPKKKEFNFLGKSEGSVIAGFFGFVKDFNNNILIKKKYMGVRVPSNTLPIARDVFGNLILLSVKGSDRGKVYFWDHEKEFRIEEEPNYSNITLIANNFDEFLASLKDIDELEEDAK